VEDLHKQKLPHCLHTPSPTLHHPRVGMRGDIENWEVISGALLAGGEFLDAGHVGQGMWDRLPSVPPSE